MYFDKNFIVILLNRPFWRKKINFSLLLELTNCTDNLRIKNHGSKKEKFRKKIHKLYFA